MILILSNSSIGRKTVYLGHRRFLDRHHPYRRLRKRFNGSPEYASAAIPLTGEEVYRRVENLKVEFGKEKKKKKKTNIWKKRSIFLLLLVSFISSNHI